MRSHSESPRARAGAPAPTPVNSYHTVCVCVCVPPRDVPGGGGRGAADARGAGCWTRPRQPRLLACAVRPPERLRVHSADSSLSQGPLSTRISRPPPP